MKTLVVWASVAGTGAALTMMACSSGATCKDGYAVYEGSMVREAEFSTSTRSLLTSTGNGGTVWRWFQDQGRMRLDFGKTETEEPPKVGQAIKFKAPIVGGELFLPPDGPRKITGGNVEVDERGPDRATFELEGSGTVEACF